MEFKDNLKKLRLQKGLTQAQLAEKLFVSRSTVAKWENGLGLPNPESLATLQKLFDITPQEIATKEPETVIVSKNRKLRIIGQITGWAAIFALLVMMSMLPFAVQDGRYGFTPDMVAGQYYANREYIDTGDYRIYYFTFQGDWDDGRHWSDLQGWKVIKKHFWGCTLVESDSIDRVIAKNNYIVGRLYSVKGKKGYYNILHKSKIYNVENPGDPLIWDIPAELITAESITIGKAAYELQHGFFFVTPEPVEYFKIGDAWYDVVSN